MPNWENRGLSSVTLIPPIAFGDPDQHAWKTMSDALDEQENQLLEMVSEQLVKVPEECLRAKKDGACLAALAKVSTRKRCEAFLAEWKRESSKGIDLPGDNRRASTQEIASTHLAPLITDSVKGSRLHCIM